MAGSSPTHPKSNRECPAREDSQKSGSPLPRGRAAASGPRRDQLSPPPSAQKRGRDSVGDPAAKRAFRGSDDEDSRSSVFDIESQQYPDKVQPSPREPSEGQQDTAADNISRTDQGTTGVAPTHNGFAPLLFGGDTGLTEDEAEDIAAKVNTWRILPKRALPKIADFVIEISDRATSGAECERRCCEGCDACKARNEAWLEFHYLFQLLARNKEESKESKPTQMMKSGPKVDDIIKVRSQQAKQHGWKGIVEEYRADAALRHKVDLDRGQPTPAARKLGEPASPQDADAFCRNAASGQLGKAAQSIIGGVVLPDSQQLREKLREKIPPMDKCEDKPMPSYAFESDGWARCRHASRPKCWKPWMRR